MAPAWSEPTARWKPRSRKRFRRVEHENQGPKGPWFFCYLDLADNLDTNVLLYSIGAGPADAVKVETATALLDREDCILSFQILQEFYVQATRASRTVALPHNLARSFVEKWLRFPVVEGTTNLLLAALEIRTRCNFSYWDCAIIAAARAAGCETLYTEDMRHGRIIDGVAIVNPFRDAA